LVRGFASGEATADDMDFVAHRGKLARRFADVAREVPRARYCRTRSPTPSG